MPLSAKDLASLISDSTEPVVVAIVSGQDTRYYNVEHVNRTGPPVVPDGAITIYLGAELTMPER